MRTMASAPNNRFHSHIPRVQTKLMPCSGIRARPFQNNRLQGLLQKRAVMGVGSADDYGKRDTRLVRQKGSFRSIFSPVGGILSDRFLSQRGFHHGAIDALPFPTDAFHLLILHQTRLPDLLENALFHPLLKVGMNGTGTAEALSGKGLPLNSGTGDIHNGFKDTPSRQGLSTASGFPFIFFLCGAHGFGNQRFNQFPEIIGYFPRSQLPWFVHA